MGPCDLTLCGVRVRGEVGVSMVCGLVIWTALVRCPIAYLRGELRPILWNYPGLYRLVYIIIQLMT